MRPRRAPRSPSRARRRHRRGRGSAPASPSTARSNCSASSSVIDARCSGVWTITSWCPVARAGHQQLGVAAPARERILGRRRLARLEQRVLVRHRAHRPAGRVGLASAGSHGVGLGRRPALVALAQRALLAGALVRGGRLEAEGPVRPRRRQHDPQTRERVDPKLGSRHSGPGLPARSSSRSLRAASRNGVKRSIGTGKIVVELRSEPTSISVWRKRSWIATGCLPILAPPARACPRPGTRPRPR